MVPNIRPDDDVSGDDRLAAGDFSSWVTQMQRAIRGDGGSEVPCAGCTACCTSYQFIHIAPDETDTLSRIPEELLFPAPGLPRGHVVLGYDDRGHCPMLVDGKCSIYEHRPQTCRTYDCRVFPATGVDIDDHDKRLISDQARRWRFNFPTPADETEHAAVLAASTFLKEHGDVLPKGAVPTNATQMAVLAIEIHEVFLARNEATQQTTVIDPDPETVRLEVMRRSQPRPC